ncbi:hypothetical protein HanIR_Chr16g0802991 [Helianthus annuus]|nr:hypothetical protein HanIR_Chr16g0802991 [Helianthus annuus]
MNIRCLKLTSEHKHLHLLNERRSVRVHNQFANTYISLTNKQTQTRSCSCSFGSFAALWLAICGLKPT